MTLRHRNLLMSTYYYRILEEEEPYALKDGDFKIWASISDPDFDNEDNEFAEIRLHYYSNVETQNASYPDEEVKMVQCHNEFIDPNVEGLWYPGKLYCPDWTDDHNLLGTYRHNIHSWVRLAVHKCDPERRAKIGKKCASDE
jgi:hypothetical protein